MISRHQVTASDVDLGTNAEVIYALLMPSDYFYVNSTTGRVYTKVPLDREETERLTVELRVRDSE